MHTASSASPDKTKDHMTFDEILRLSIPRVHENIPNYSKISPKQI